MLVFAYASRFYSAAFVIVFWHLFGVSSPLAAQLPFLGTQQQSLKTVVPGASVPVYLKIYDSGELVLKTHVIHHHKSFDETDVQKEWELFLKCQKDKSREFTPTKLFSTRILEDASEAKDWKILEPKHDHDTFHQIQIHIGGHTIVLLNSLHLRAHESGWLLDADKLVESEFRFVRVKPAKPKPARSLPVKAPISNSRQDDVKANEDLILETGAER